jgi:hypothetical protein
MYEQMILYHSLTKQQGSSRNERKEVRHDGRYYHSRRNELTTGSALEMLTIIQGA